MKTYIKPTIEIEVSGITTSIMAGSPPPIGKGMADGEAANQGVMSDSEDLFNLDKGNLWDE